MAYQLWADLSYMNDMWDNELVVDAMPRQFRHHADDAFCARIRERLGIVLERIEHPGGVGPFTACTADEFLVCTALIRLDSLLANDPEAYGFDGYDEIFPPDEDFESVWDYEDYVLAESDYPILLNPRLDGIENDPAVGKQLRLRHLHPSEWFIINDQEE